MRNNVKLPKKLCMSKATAMGNATPQRDGSKKASPGLGSDKFQLAFGHEFIRHIPPLSMRLFEKECGPLGLLR